MIQSVPYTPSSSKFLKMLTLAIPGVTPITPATGTYQSTGSGSSWMDMVQPLYMVDPNDIAREAEDKRKDTKDALMELEPDDSIAQPIILSNYDGVTGEITFTTF
jgi:hypothetical protein